MVIHFYSNFDGALIFDLKSLIQFRIQQLFSQAMLKISFNRNHPLSFKSISQLEQQEAQDILAKFNRTIETRKNIEENYVIKNGVLVKEDNENTISAFEAKIKTPFNPHSNNNEKHSNFQTDFNIRHTLTTKSKAAQKLQILKQHSRQNSNFNMDDESLILNFLQKDNSEQQRLKNDYCRLWYEKLALETAFNSVINESYKKDEIIRQLIQQQELKGNGSPQFPFNQPNFNSTNPQTNALNYKNVHPTIKIQQNSMSPIPLQNQNRPYITPNMRSNF